MTKSSNAFASQGLGSGREGKRNGEEESRRRQSAGWDRQAVSHVCCLPFIPYCLYHRGMILTFFTLT